MGLIDSLFMGHKKNKHKKKNKSSNHQAHYNNRSANNGKTHKVIHRRSRKENVYEVADTVFGGKYFCAGDSEALG